MPTVDEALDNIETQVGLLRGQGVDPTRISGLEQSVYEAKLARSYEDLAAAADAGLAVAEPASPADTPTPPVA